MKLPPLPEPVSDIIRNRINKLLIEQDGIENAIAVERRKIQATGNKYDSLLLIRAKNEFNKNKRYIVDFQNQLSKIARKERKDTKEANVKSASEEKKSFDRLFMLKSKEMLPDKLYKTILNESMYSKDYQ